VTTIIRLLTKMLVSASQFLFRVFMEVFIQGLLASVPSDGPTHNTTGFSSGSFRFSKKMTTAWNPRSENHGFYGP